ncbi:calponin homology domain-containing protein, partial [Pavlovales sp. CCMP2436]
MPILTPTRRGALGAVGAGGTNSPRVSLSGKQWSSGSEAASAKENELKENELELLSATASFALEDTGQQQPTPSNASSSDADKLPTPSTAEVTRVPQPLKLEVPNTPRVLEEPAEAELDLDLPAGAGDGGPVLQIAQFAACPWVDFGRVLVGKAMPAAFTVHNPTGSAQTISAVSDSLGKGIDIESPQFPLRVPTHASVRVVLVWTPKAEGSFAAKIEFNWKGRRALATMVRGDACRAAPTEAAQAAVRRSAARFSVPHTLVLESKRPSDWGGNGLRRKAENAPAVSSRAPLSRTSATPLGLLDRAADFATFDSFRASDAPPPPSASKPSASAPSSRRVSDAPSLASTMAAAHVSRATTNAAVRHIEGAALRKQHESSSEARSKAQAPSRPSHASSTLSLRKPTVATRAPPPEARKQLYDVNWREKQERLYTRWVNFSLSSSTAGGADVAEGACARQLGAVAALEAWRAEASIRRGALKLARNFPLGKTLGRIEAAVAEGSLRLRESPDLLADVGLRANFCNMLLCVNPLWLRPALEVVLGEMVLMPNGPLDSAALRRAVEQRVLGESGALASPAEAVVMRAHTLRATVQLVVFLDAAKSAKLLGESDPCLFDVTARIKSTKAMLQLFAKDFVSAGGGDLARHVAQLGHTLTASQSALDEFNFGVENLAVDMRDGIRLSALIRRLGAAACVRSGGPPGAAASLDLEKELRVPAPSRLQKLHNVKVALSTLVAAGAPPAPMELEARGVVDGDCTVTLNVLWRVVAHFELPRLLQPAALKAELARLRAEGGNGRHAAELKDDFDELDGSLEYLLDDERLALLLSWARLAVAPFGVPVRNLSTSFADGRALCFAVHRYAPWLLGREQVSGTVATLEAGLAKRENEAERDALSSGRWVQTYDMHATDEEYKAAREGERANWRLLASAVRELGGMPTLIAAADAVGTVPDEKMVVMACAFLFARLHEVAREARAATTLQTSVRVHAQGAIKMRSDRPKLADAVRAHAAVGVQSAWRALLARVQLKAHRAAVATAVAARVAEAEAAVAAVAAVVAAKAAAAHFTREVAATRLQAEARRILVARDVAELRAILHHMQQSAATMLQAKARGLAARILLHGARAAAVQLQAAARRRGAIVERRVLAEQRACRVAAVRLQAAARGR